MFSQLVHRQSLERGTPWCLRRFVAKQAARPYFDSGVSAQQLTAIIKSQHWTRNGSHGWALSFFASGIAAILVTFLSIREELFMFLFSSLYGDKYTGTL